MGKQAELSLGAIYRYYQGMLRPLYPTISISNAICFSPDYKYGYFADTAAQTIQRQPLSYNDGWPEGDPELWLDLTAEDRYPDGSVVDTEECVWNAQWGSSRIARYAPDGQFLSAISFSTSQISYPAFGAERMQTVFATSATVGLNDHEAQAGQSFVCNTPYVGQQEHRVIL
jgi:sugar lactone lactonase YvrE